MSRTAILAGTGFDDRAVIIRKHCRPGTPVYLTREPGNAYAPNAVAVYIALPRLGGLFGSGKKQIGYVKKGPQKALPSD